MSKLSDLARELRNHAVDNHTRGCGGRTYSCECGYDSKDRAPAARGGRAHRAAGGELRGMPNRSTARTNRSDLHTRRMVRVAKKAPLRGEQVAVRCHSHGITWGGRATLIALWTCSKRAAR